MTTTKGSDQRSAYERLPKRLKRFVDALVLGATGSAAARQAGCKGIDPKQWAYRIRRRSKWSADIETAIAERDAWAAEEAGITRTRVMLEVARVAFFDHRSLYDADGNPLPIHKLPDDAAAGLASTEVEELFEGRGEQRQQVGRILKYRSWPKVDALKLAAQLGKMIAERHELSGPGGGPIETSQTQQIVAALNETTDPNVAAELYHRLVKGDL